MHRSAVFVGLALVALGVLGASSAATLPLPLAGSLDPSFGQGGVVDYPDSKVFAGNEGIAIQPDGKILVAASGPLVRYLPDGSLDPSFGDGRSVTTGFFPDAVALQPDGKIVVAGSSGPDSALTSELAIARYNPDGSPDTSFGTNGLTETAFPEPPDDCSDGPGLTANATSIAVLPGGEILAAGTVRGEEYCDFWSAFALARYSSDGSLDPAFGDAGTVETSFIRQDVLDGIAVQPDGKIVATGFAGESGHGGLDVAGMGLARYAPDRSLDPTFGSGGKVTVNTGGLSYTEGGPSVLEHGKILVAGADSKNGTPKSWFPVLARFRAGGRLDPTFGQHGFAKIKRRLGEPTAMLAQKDGKLLVAESPTYQGQPSSLVRLLPDGRLDKSFGKGGIVSFWDEVWQLGLQPDRKILVGASSDAGWTLDRLLGGNNCAVPGLQRRTLSKASTALEKAYCRRGQLAKRFSAKIARGKVIATAPRAGTRLPDGTKVALVVSKGKRR